MKSVIFTAAIIFISISASAGTFYRCQIDGRTIISNVPCTGQVIETREIQTMPSTSESQPSLPATTLPQRKITTPTIPPSPTRSAPVKKEYIVNHSISTRGGNVEISGRITGPQCRSLRVDVWARTPDGGIVGCTSVVELFGLSTIFRCSDKTWRNSRDWFVSSLYVNCQD